MAAHGSAIRRSQAFAFGPGPSLQDGERSAPSSAVCAAGWAPQERRPLEVGRSGSAVRCVGEYLKRLVQVHHSPERSIAARQCGLRAPCAAGEDRGDVVRLQRRTEACERDSLAHARGPGWRRDALRHWLPCLSGGAAIPSFSTPRRGGRMLCGQAWSGAPQAACVPQESRPLEGSLIQAPPAASAQDAEQGHQGDHPAEHDQ